MQHHDLRVFADYHQFYVWDAGVDPKAPEDYDDSDVQRRVKVAPNVVAIQPLRNAEVPVGVAVHAQDPGYDSSEWDHIVEADLELPTGRMQVHESTGGPVLELALPRGAYRVRVLFAGLGTVSSDTTEGNDRYLVAVWPEGPRGLRVVKQWTQRGAR